MVSIFDELNKNCQKELAAVQGQYPFEPLKYRPMGQTLVIPFPEAVKMLKADGVEMGEFDDFTSVDETTSRGGRLSSFFLFDDSTFRC